MTISDDDLPSGRLDSLELKLLKAGIPYHIHTGRHKFMCTSPYCKHLFDEEPGVASGEDPAQYIQVELNA